MTISGIARVAGGVPVGVKIVVMITILITGAIMWRGVDTDEPFEASVEYRPLPHPDMKHRDHELHAKCFGLYTQRAPWSLADAEMLASVALDASVHVQVRVDAMLIGGGRFRNGWPIEPDAFERAIESYKVAMKDRDAEIRLAGFNACQEMNVLLRQDVRVLAEMICKDADPLVAASAAWKFDMAKMESLPHSGGVVP